MYYFFIAHNIQKAIVLETRIVVLVEGSKVVVDEMNGIPKPVTLALLGYGAFWKQLHSALY